MDPVSFTLLRGHLRSVLATLSKCEASIVRLRFGLTDGQPRTLDEIGQAHGVTHSTLRSVSPIHIEYLRNMKVKAAAASRAPGF